MSEPYVKFVVGDALTVLRDMPDASVDLVLSSPPFLGLRSYLPSDDPNKAQEMGSEATPGEFIDALLDIVEECRRVLAPHGSLCLELGDTYAGSGGGGGDYSADGLRAGQPVFDGSGRRARETRREAFVLNGVTPSPRRVLTDGWPLDKSLCGVPELLRLSMAYGRNLLTRRETPRWRVRNVVRWCRPNPPVGALADKFRPATSDLLVACVGRSRYFDLDAVRQPRREPSAQVPSPKACAGVDEGIHGKGWPATGDWHANGGAPPLDWWKVSTEAYPGSHYATWPSKLLVRPIDAMCPRQVCTVCGRPSERLVDVDYTKSHGNSGSRRDAAEPNGRTNGTGMAYKPRADRVAETTGWTDCGHDSWRPGVVLDPFAGSGTTLAVAHGHGRSAIGIDLDARNAELARERVGMWLEVEGENGSPSIAEVAVAGDAL